MNKILRNDKCPCGSNKKYKNCHLDKYTFYLKVDIVGPFLPKSGSLIENGEFIYTSVDLESLKWNTLPSMHVNSTNSITNQCSIYSELNININNPSEVIFIKTIDQPSFLNAYNEIYKEIETFCTILSISITGGAYFFNTKEIAMGIHPINNVSKDSLPSGKIHVISYLKEPMKGEEIEFNKQFVNLYKKNNDLSKLLFFSQKL